MYDFSRQIATFHKDHVRLTRPQQGDMRNKRDVNLKRIGNGLQELRKPAVVEVINQGGYAQRTMTQPPEADQISRSDIDLGVVFNSESVASARVTRNWVRDALELKATNMKHPPETKHKCVRVVYADGYQCDFPVFRRTASAIGLYQYELSAGDDWIFSDPAAMNRWIESQISSRSPETDGSYQLRRIIRLGKFFTKTHANRRRLNFPGGLVATALFIEAYQPVAGRDDMAFRETLRNIATRMPGYAIYANGVRISDDKDTERVARLMTEAALAAEQLDRLNQVGTTISDAQKAWKFAFRHGFFDQPFATASSGGIASLVRSTAQPATIAAPMIASATAAALTEQDRIERMEAALLERQMRGGGRKPWAR